LFAHVLPSIVPPAGVQENRHRDSTNGQVYMSWVIPDMLFHGSLGFESRNAGCCCSAYGESARSKYSSFGVEESRCVSERFGVRGGGLRKGLMEGVELG
jgi:hypothetical protein